MEDHLSTEDLFVKASVASSSDSLPSIESLRLDPEDSAKMKLFKQGLYSPGSGEICAKYITMSRSSMLRHKYYEYPSVKDPGIERALLYPAEQKVYDEDAQELYLDLCRTMNLVPYYGVNPAGMRAMCLALAYNQTVKHLDLTSNFLDHSDACYHLGQMLGDRNALKELVLSGCKLNLSHNNLTSDSLTLFAEVIEFHDHIMYLNLSWNKFMKHKGPATLCRILGESSVLVELNMSWTSLSLTTELGNLLSIETLKVLDLSNNKLSSPSARVIARALYMAKSLKILDLSCNPLSPSDALYLLVRMKQEKIKLKELLMNHITVSKEFAIEFKEIMKLEFRKYAVITHGEILRNYTLPEHDIKIIIMKRMVLNMKKHRKNKLDILLYLLEQQKKNKYLDSSEFVRILKLYDAPIKEDFIEDLVKVFPGPKTGTGSRTINLDIVVDYIRRLWPNKKLPPTPPPTPPPPPLPEKSKKNRKEKQEKK